MIPTIDESSGPIVERIQEGLLRALATAEPTLGYAQVRGLTVPWDKVMAPEGLLPLFVLDAVEQFHLSGLSNGGMTFPLRLRADDDALLGVRVTWRKTQGRSTALAMLFMQDAVTRYIAHSKKLGLEAAPNTAQREMHSVDFDLLCDRYDTQITEAATTAQRQSPRT